MGYYLVSLGFELWTAGWYLDKSTEIWRPQLQSVPRCFNGIIVLHDFSHLIFHLLSSRG